MSFPSTIDWDDHWKTTDREELSEMRAAGERTIDRLERLYESLPASLADVGCGPAFMLFEFARRHPEVDLYGYDAADSVVRRNRSLAAERGLDALTFETAWLPMFEVNRRFECVTCLATLHYVAEPRAALRALYDRVEPGGRLIFNYPNRYTRRMYREDPETDHERFELVLDGENLLSYDGVRETLSRPPRSFWKAVGEDDWRSLGRVNPCVVITKSP
ncbi:class I SAM-dependent methyltransferase [Halorubrum sp. RMP-47]|uniref:Class I SAM-dependent methyltransferase n=1 Tax=Halorubrum miltondacostae TaxID=3076378 RepID=A0ABD5LZ66_9EURY